MDMIHVCIIKKYLKNTLARIKNIYDERSLKVVDVESRNDKDVVWLKIEYSSPSILISLGMDIHYVMVNNDIL